MATGGLREEEVKNQLRQMCNFILKEAIEKAEEIRVKAEEEFNIEKQKILQAEKIKIMKDFERKEKQVEVQKKIAHSNELNASRLRTLKARDDAVNGVLQKAYRHLNGISEGPNYRDLLIELTVQALIKLEEPTCFVMCREADHSLVNSILPKCAEKYEKTIPGKKVKMTIDTVNRLAPPRVEGSDAAFCSGGIVLATAEGRILCNNTLEQRLALAFDQLLPTIRVMMFGHGAGRKYFN